MPYPRPPTSQQQHLLYRPKLLALGTIAECSVLGKHVCLIKTLFPVAGGAKDYFTTSSKMQRQNQKRDFADTTYNFATGSLNWTHASNKSSQSHCWLRETQKCVSQPHHAQHGHVWHPSQKPRVMLGDWVLHWHAKDLMPRNCAKSKKKTLPHVNIFRGLL